MREQIQQFIHPETIIKSPLRQIGPGLLTGLHITPSEGRLRARQAYDEHTEELHKNLQMRLNEERGLTATRAEE